MPKAYPWVMRLTHRLYPEAGCVIVGVSLSTGAPPALPAVAAILPFQGKSLFGRRPGELPLAPTATQESYAVKVVQYKL